MGVRILLHHVVLREALQHAVHGRPLQAAARRQVEQTRSRSIVCSDLSHQGERALYALSAGQWAFFIGGVLLRHGSILEVRIVKGRERIMTPRPVVAEDWALCYF